MSSYNQYSPYPDIGGGLLDFLTTMMGIMQYRRDMEQKDAWLKIYQNMYSPRGNREGGEEGVDLKDANPWPSWRVNTGGNLNFDLRNAPGAAGSFTLGQGAPTTVGATTSNIGRENFSPQGLSPEIYDEVMDIYNRIMAAKKNK